MGQGVRVSTGLSESNISQINGDSDMVLSESAGCVVRGLNKGTMSLVQHFSLERAAPPAFTLKPDNLIFLCMSLALFELPSLL